jgi:hypothetical protein
MGSASDPQDQAAWVSWSLNQGHPSFSVQEAHGLDFRASRRGKASSARSLEGKSTFPRCPGQPST